MRSALLGLLAGVTIIGCKPDGGPRTSKSISYPKEFGVADVSTLKQQYSAQQIFPLQDRGRSYMALSFEESPSDYKVVFYRREGDRFRRFGPEFNPTGFDAPYLGPGPRIEIVMKQFGLKHAFIIKDDDVDLEPIPTDGVSVGPAVRVK